MFLYPISVIQCETNRDGFSGKSLLFYLSVTQEKIEVCAVGCHIIMVVNSVLPLHSKTGWVKVWEVLGTGHRSVPELHRSKTLCI